MLRAEDLFQDVRVREREDHLEVLKELRDIDSQILMVNRSQALNNSPGWQDFIKSVNDAIDRGVTELVNTTKSNEYMRQQQGRVQALRDVATMLTRGKSLLEELAKRRQLVQDRLAELLRRAPRQAKAEQT